MRCGEESRAEDAYRVVLGRVCGRVQRGEGAPGPWESEGAVCAVGGGRKFQRRALVYRSSCVLAEYSMRATEGLLRNRGSAVASRYAMRFAERSGGNSSTASCCYCRGSAGLQGPGEDAERRHASTCHHDHTPIRRQLISQLGKVPQFGRFPR